MKANSENYWVKADYPSPHSNAVSIEMIPASFSMTNFNGGPKVRRGLAKHRSRDYCQAPKWARHLKIGLLAAKNMQMLSLATIQERKRLCMVSICHCVQALILNYICLDRPAKWAWNTVVHVCMWPSFMHTLWGHICFWVLQQRV